MSWSEFIMQWRAKVLIDLGIPKRTVYDWRAGTKEPKDWHRTAAEHWIAAAAGEKEPAPPQPKAPRGKSKK